MTKTTFVAILSFLSVSFISNNASAQVCGGAIGIGPFGIGVVVDCPPPVVVVRRPRIVRVRPRPKVIIIKRNGCNRGCHRPAPVYRRRPVVRRPVPMAPPASVVAAPRAISTPRYDNFNRLTLGAMVDSSSFEDGGLMGGSVFLRYLFTRNIGLESSISSLKSCTNCNEFASRTDNRVGISALYFLGGSKSKGLNFYLKSGFLFNNITFDNEVSGESEVITQTNFEFGGGVELKLSSSLSLQLEATGMVPSSDDNSIGTGPLNEHISKGIPSSSNSNSAFNLRAGIAIHF